GLGPVRVSMCRLLLTHAYQAGEPSVALAGAAGMSCAVELPGAGGDSGGEGEEQAARARTAAAQYTRRIRMTNTDGDAMPSLTRQPPAKAKRPLTACAVRQTARRLPQNPSPTLTHKRRPLSTIQLPSRPVRRLR